jgi:hypothetical protein
VEPEPRPRRRVDGVFQLRPVSEQRQAELIKYLALRPTSPDAASALEGKIEEIIKLRKQDQEERDEREGLLDLYMRAMEQAGPEKVAKAA